MLKIYLKLTQPYNDLAYFDVSFLNKAGQKLGQHRLAPAWGLKAPADWPIGQTIGSYYQLTLPLKTDALKISLAERESDGQPKMTGHHYRLIPIYPPVP